MPSPRLLSAFLALPVLAQPAKAPSESEAARKAAQAFYDWYAPMAMKNAKEPAFVRSLRERKAALTEELAQALAADAAAQKAVPDDIVGLDWDPFLNAQDSYAKYVAGEVKAEGKGFLVAMHSVQGGKKGAEVLFLVEMVLKDGKFVIGNVRSPKGGDLVSSLKQLAEERKKMGKK